MENFQFIDPLYIMYHGSQDKGLIVKKGTLVDATVIQATPKKPPQNEDGTAGKSAVDSDAD